MASRSAQIPRFLLPQTSTAWRAISRHSGIPRTFALEQAQLIVRHATTAATPKTTAKVVTKSTSKAAAKVTTAKVSTAKLTTKATPKATTTKSTATTTATASRAAAKTAAKATLASAKPTATKTNAAKTTTSTAAAAAAAYTPKSPAPKPVLTPKSSAAKTASSPTPPPPSTPSPADPTKTAPAPEGGADSLPASLTTDRAGPIILEQPDAFRPPSHGKRLPRAMPKVYGGGPTAEDIQAQRTKQYPGMPPPENTWSHWFLNSRGIHLFITLGTLSGLAVYTFAVNFQANSQFADMIPPISEFPRHPFQYMGVCIDVLKLHEEHESAITAEKRRQKIEDVAKRNEFRKAHGLEPASGVAPWASKSPTPVEVEVDGETQAQARVTAATSIAAERTGPSSLAETGEFTEEGKRKKFLGIF